MWPRLRASLLLLRRGHRCVFVCPYSLISLSLPPAFHPTLSLLTHIPSFHPSQTGFRGVSRSGRRFEARISQGSGVKCHLGNFLTAEAAALAVARCEAVATSQGEGFTKAEAIAAVASPKGIHLLQGKKPWLKSPSCWRQASTTASAAAAAPPPPPAAAAASAAAASAQPQPPPINNNNSSNSLLSSSASVEPSASRVGDDYQVSPNCIPQHAPLLSLPPPNPPPICQCNQPAIWKRRRWSCANKEVRGGGCELRLSESDERPTCHGNDPIVSHTDLAKEAANATAALLTAAAYGPYNEWSFIAPSSAPYGSIDGLGLYARVSLKAGQAIGEFSGPRLPIRMLPTIEERTLGTLPISGSHTFIDGYHENLPLGRYPHLDGPMATAMYACAATSSDLPNARIETWPVLRSFSSTDRVRHRLWLVTTEPIEAGGEIRVDRTMDLAAMEEAGRLVAAAPQSHNNSSSSGGSQISSGNQIMRGIPPPPPVTVCGEASVAAASAASRSSSLSDGCGVEEACSTTTATTPPTARVDPSSTSVSPPSLLLDGEYALVETRNRNDNEGCCREEEPDVAMPQKESGKAVGGCGGASSEEGNDEEDNDVMEEEEDDDLNAAPPRWKSIRLPCPPPTHCEPVIDRLGELQAAMLLGSIEEVEELARAELEAQEEQALAGCDGLGSYQIPWTTATTALQTIREEESGGGGVEGRVRVPPPSSDGAGDARLRVLVPLLVGGGSRGGESAAWATLATHLPGRSGRECRERWAVINASVPQQAASAKEEVEAPAKPETSESDLSVRA